MGDQFALKNNQIFVLAEAAGGVYNSDQLRVLCEVADNESAFLKITEDQRVGFMVDPNRLADVQSHVRKSGLLLRSYKSSGVPSPRACLGELCTFAHQPSLGDALELTTHLLKSFPAPKRFSSIGINGCQRACLGSSTEDIHVVAEESGYKVSIGGKSSDIPQQAQLILENISRTDLPIVIEKILAVFYQESQDNERVFDVIDRIGLTPFFDALPEHLTPHVNENEDTASTESSSATPADAIGSKIQTDDLKTSADPLSSSIETIDETIDETMDGALDDLLESSSDEFNTDETLILPAVGTNAPTHSIPLEMESETSLEELEQDEIMSEQIGEGLAGDLLEVSESELQEGSSEDVERLRAAIRTELSLSSGTEQVIPSQTKDLLDDLGSLSDDLPAVDEFLTPSFEDESDSILETPISDDVLEENTEDADFQLLNETAANLEHQKPNNRPTSEQRTTPKSGKRPSSSPTSTQPVVGRLAIRFDGPQLAVELPSGLSFELPFSSVSEFGQLAMTLPDGELQIAREGTTLAVSLGMLTLRIPIPETEELQVA